MEYLIIGLAVAFNLLIVIWKFQSNRILDATIDGTLLVLVALVFSGTYGALVAGTVGSAVVSLYLLFNPPKWTPRGRTKSA